MARLGPALVLARVAHKRLLPRRNGFSYSAYYVAIPLESIEDGSLDAHLPLRRLALHSFYPEDHGYRDGSSLRQWAEDAVRPPVPCDVTLVCMPRVLGYVFNPVSFWLWRDRQGELRAAVCEVNNTFGESHSYLCMHQDGRPIRPEDTLLADKLFHVSPFLDRGGSYQFKFNVSADRCHVQIDYLDEARQKALLTYMDGRLRELSARSLRAAFVRCPFLTVKVIAMIHYQALRLLLKGMRYRKKPEPLEPRLTKTRR